MFVEVGTAATLGKTATELLIEHRKQIFPFVRRLYFRMTKGTLRVIIFGPSGTGKTTLSKLLSRQLTAGSVPGKYEPSISTEEFNLPGDVPTTLIVPPGQPEREAYTWPELYNSLASGKSHGVINIVSYGYHSLGEVSYKNITRIWNEGMNQEKFFYKIS